MNDVNEYIDLEELFNKSIKGFNKVNKSKEFEIIESIKLIREFNDFKSFSDVTNSTKELFLTHMTDVYYSENLNNLCNLDVFLDLSVRFYSNYIKTKLF